jgi:hypothetical protein
MIPNRTVSDLESLETVSKVAAPVAAAAERLRLVTEAAEAKKARAMGELRQALMRVGRSALDAGHRDELARVLYWRHTDLPVRDIAVALGFADQRTLLAAVGPIATVVACERCATPLLATSRSRRAELQKLATSRSLRHGSRPICDACRELRASAEAAAWRAASALVMGDADDDGRPSDPYGRHRALDSLDCDPDELVGVELDDAERLAQAVAELAAADEMGATRVVRRAGFEGTAADLAGRLADAVSRAPRDLRTD